MQALRKSTFIFGKARPSLILPRERNEGEKDDSDRSPIRWITVDFVSTPEVEKLEVDVHAFIFTHDGEYIDCVFYKNPVLAGKSVRLQGTTLYIDLHTLPARAGFIVITLAVYSGGTLASLTKCSTQVQAYIPKDLSEDPAATSAVGLAAGSFPSPEDHWEAVLATMDITNSVIGGAPDAKGLLNCLLAEEEGNWFLKVLLQPVAAFTPHALIESAQRAVRHYQHAVDNDQNTWSVPLGDLLDAALQGKETKLEPAEEGADYDSQDELGAGAGEEGDMAGEGDRGSNRSSVEGEDGFEGHRGFFERLNQNRDGSDGDDEDFALEGGTRGRGRGRGAHGEGEQDGPGKLKGLERFEKKPSEDVDYRQGRRWARPEKVGEGEEELDEKDYGYGGEGNVRAAGGRYGAGGEGKATGEDGDQDGDGEGEEDDDSFFGGPWGRRLHDHEQTGDHEHTGDDSDSHGEGRWGGERYPGGGGRGGDGDVGSSSRSGASDSDWSGLGELWNTTTTTEGGSSEIGRGKSRGALGVALGFKEGRGDPGEDSGASGKKGKRSPFDSSFSSSSAFDRRKSRVAFLNHPDGADSHTVGDQGGEAMKTEKSSRFNGKGEAGAEEGGAKEKETQWRSQIEERLEQLEKGLTGITRAVQQVANGTKEMNDKMQDWFSMIGGKLSRLQSDVDMQRNLRGGSGGSDFGTTGAEPHGQESVNRRLQDLSRLMTMGERSQQQISQSITELKSQLAGFERRLPPSMIPVDEGKRPANPDLVVDEIIVRGQGRHRSSPSYTETTTVEDGGEDDDDEGDDGRDHDERSSPMDTSSRRCCCCCCCCCPCCKKSSQQPQDSSSCCPCMAMLSQQRQNPAHQKELYGDHNSADRRLLLSDVKARIETVLRNVEKIDEYGEELGDLLRCLASCTAPDGLKGLNPVEKKLFTFAGTPKTFEALHTFESALDRLRVCGTGLADH